MKVLVTGGAGFLGTHVCQHFREQGHEVVVYDNLTEHELHRTQYNVKASRKHNVEFIKDLGCTFHKVDITRSLPYDKDIEYIVHCAAQPAMTIAIENPYLDISTNVMGTYYMLELARKLDIPIANCSSIHVYGNNLNKSLTEMDTRFISIPPSIGEEAFILQGDVSPLHASKRSAELYVQAFTETYGLRATTFRLTGMYGPRQFGGMDHGWVANFAIRTVMERPITVFDTGKQVRDILYARDAARAFDLWYKHGESEIYNIGGGMQNSISLQECLNLLVEITGKEQDITIAPPRFGDLYYFVCDSTKAASEFKWKPQMSNIEGLRSLVNWITVNKNIL